MELSVPLCHCSSRENNIDLNAGFFYSAAAICSFSLRLITGRASDRYGRGLVYYCQSGLLHHCYGDAAFCSFTNEVLLAASIQGAGGGTLIPTMVALMADRSKPKERGQVFSLCIGGFDLGIALAGPVLGYVADSSGLSIFICDRCGSRRHRTCQLPHPIQQRPASFLQICLGSRKRYLRPQRIKP